MTVCDISRGRVVVDKSILKQCNSSDVAISYPSPLVITGTTTRYRVEIFQSELSVRLVNVNIKSWDPFSCHDSTVDISVEGANRIQSAQDTAAGIDCSEGSSLSFTGSPGSSLQAIGGPGTPGIGAGPNTVCNSISLADGTYVAQGGPGSIGIGAGRGMSRLTKLTMERSAVSAGGTAAIGTTFSDRSVTEVTIIESNVSGLGSQNGIAPSEKLRLSGNVSLVVNASVQSALQGRRIAVDGARISARTDATQLFGIAPMLAKPVDLSILYTTVATEPAKPLTTLPGLEIGSLTLPTAGEWTVSIESVDRS
jgi:hypothetical protein